ncbi:patatin-like phospholipase family protein [Qipengyuania atrilutea]|uniref:Patatin-like phospholipase family protein n=1 Tax=Qipengyuania atrilutea TaxID=2744473 RepID=A0A850H286_9SPHN|nr:patatin-like phospholipase family protein [Actirhodobacter atriluteus]NVD44796.1 patatin-like phospholipase family protein [Actirhodobacter atriluteus]
MPSSTPDYRYDQTALVFQGGGALGAFQAGAYEAFHELDVEPNWYAGISIGSVNAAIIAGNAPDERVPMLRSFWNLVTSGPPDGGDNWNLGISGVYGARAASVLGTAASMLGGAPGFFKPRGPAQFFAEPGSIDAVSFYDTAPLIETLKSHVDFERLNHPKAARVSLGAVEVENGNFVYFDNREHTMGPEHVMASGALPPGLPWIEIEGVKYWDGGLVSNTPLAHVLRECRGDALVFEVDLFPARGALPQTLIDVEERRKDIVYSSRTRMNTDAFRERHALKNALRKVIESIPEEDRDTKEIRHARRLIANHRVTLVHLIYRHDGFIGASKDYEFSRTSMLRHWQQGRADAAEILAHDCWRQPPPHDEAIAVYDLDHTRGLDERHGMDRIGLREQHEPKMPEKGT